MNEEEIIYDSIENYMAIAKNNDTPNSDYCSILSLLNQLESQYPSYKKIDKYKEKLKKCILKVDENNIANNYFKKYGTNPQKAYEIMKFNNGWVDGSTSRPFSFLIIIGLVGKPYDKMSKEIISRAYSWNWTAFCKQKIYYLQLYIQENLSKKERNLAYSDLAKAYVENKMYDEAINCYRKLIKYDKKDYYPYIKISDIYVKNNKIDEAINFLNDTKKSFVCIFNKELKNIIEKEYIRVSNLKIGISQHIFLGFDAIEDWSKPYFNNVRKDYINDFELYRKIMQDIDKIKYELNINEIKANEETNKYYELCLKALEIVPRLQEYYKKINKLGFHNIYKLSDNYQNGLPYIKSCVIFLEKQGKFIEAIELCNIAIKLGYIDDGTKGGYSSRIERIKKKVK